MMEVGVARPMAQGQAMMSTATALTSAKLSAGDGPQASHAPKVSRATAITAGTNHMVTWSTSACMRSEEHTSELQSPCNLVCRLLLEKKKKQENREQATHSSRTLCQHDTSTMRAVPI